MWIQIIKHIKWQLFTITDKGIPGPGNSQIAKASRGFAPGPHMGGLQRPPFFCSKLTIETVEQGVKHVQSEQ